nr:baseplate J/gp47 family protein [Methanobrevibacter arboriphilus]
MDIIVEEDEYYDKRNGQRIYLSDFVNKNFEKYSSSAYAGLTKITDFTPGSEAYHQLILASKIEMENVILQDQEGSQKTFMTANFDNLDDFGYQKEVLRDSGKFATDDVIFTIPAVRMTDIKLLAGFEVATPDGIIFNLNDDVIIPSGSTSCYGNVTCLESGSIGNVKAGEISIIVNDPGFPISVTNTTDFTNGENPEDDDNYRFRIRNESNNYPPFSYAWMQMKAKKIVPDARYSLNTAGNLGTIYFKPSDNESDDLSKLTSLFNEPQNKPALVNLQFVKGDDIVVINESMRIIISINNSYSFGIIKEQAINLVKEYVNSLNMGDVFEINMIKFIIMTIEGVIGVETENVSNVNLAINEYPIIESLNINQG